MAHSLILLLRDESNYLTGFGPIISTIEGRKRGVNRAGDPKSEVEKETF